AFERDGSTYAASPGGHLVIGSGTRLVTIDIGSPGSVKIDSAGSIALAGTVKGDLTVIALGSVIETGPLSVTGNMTIASAGAVSLTQLDQHFSGNLTITAGVGDIVLANTATTQGSALTTASVTGGPITLAIDTASFHGAVTLSTTGYSAVENPT